MGKPAEEILLFVSGVEEFLLSSSVLGWKDRHIEREHRHIEEKPDNDHSVMIGKLCVSGKLFPAKYCPSLNNLRKFYEKGVFLGSLFKDPNNV